MTAFSLTPTFASSHAFARHSVFYERNIRGFAKVCCVSAVLNTEILLMLSFGEQGRYGATSEVITAVLLRTDIWDVQTPCGLAF
jgi:hypothetical protein